MSASFYQQAVFNLSSPNLAKSPPDNGYEVAFVGCSNVGKSSTINAITSQTQLAKISKTPGRTQHLVYFDLANNRRLVDLPGYGYAKVPRALKRKWQQEINDYFLKRQSLKGTILIVDIRRSLKLLDEQMLKWCTRVHIPIHIVMTKADKLSRGAASNAKLKMVQQLSSYPQVSIQTFSAVTKQNLEQIWGKLDEMLQR